MAKITIRELRLAGVEVPSDSESFLNDLTEAEHIYGGRLNFGFTNQFLTFTSIQANLFLKLAALDLLAGIAGLTHSIADSFVAPELPDSFDPIDIDKDN